MGRYISYIVLIIILIIGISFAILNASPVTVDYYAAKTTLPLSIVIFGSFVLGIIVGILVMLPKWLSARFSIRRLRKQVKQQSDAVEGE